MWVDVVRGIDVSGRVVEDSSILIHPNTLIPIRILRLKLGMSHLLLFSLSKVTVSVFIIEKYYI
jgi:hypothetical protein